MTRTVLVTGFGGLIGGAVARRLAAEGRQVVAADVHAFSGLPFPFVTHDLSNSDSWHGIITRFGITDIVHAGGVSGPMLLQDQPSRVCDINLNGLTGSLEAARIHLLRRIVWFSSIAVYGDRTSLAPVSEESSIHPTTVYAATKAAGEAMLAGYYSEHGVDGVALRVASCYGPGRTSPCLIRTLIEDAFAERVTAVKESPLRSRQHIFVQDVARAAIAALDAENLPQRVYNIGPGRMQSLDEIEAGVRSAVPNARIELRDSGFAWNTFAVGPLLIDAARRDLGFEPSTPLSEGAKQTALWVRQQGRLD